MVTKEELKDWLNESARKRYEEKLEKYIDESIKTNALSGKTTFDICTGKYTPDGSRKTPFYDLWYTNELSEENREVVHKRIIEKYKSFGFDVKETTVDCGWHHSYFALEFKNIDKVIKN
ncbi:hypothetical protein [Neobacillus sedimentimangrovi]|uniref:hypothetical protein n=1 Tax=Neobacillus sedimentimangrovi TaxID=2699460 RepID=UPI0013D56345|nr:hypothetical protein [Neobacillus sedimentimangrovi]